MLVLDMMLKRGLKGELDLMGPAQAVAKELMAVPDFGADQSDEFFAAEKKVLANLKKAGLMIAGAAVQKLMQNLNQEQEILMNLADILIQVYVAESAILRTEKLIGIKGEEASARQIDMARTYLHHAVDQAQRAGKEAIYAFADGDEMRMMLLGLKRFTKIEPYNIVQARRRIADAMIEKNDYIY